MVEHHRERPERAKAGRLTGRDLVALVLAFGVVGALLATTIGVVVVHGVAVVTATEGGLLGSVLGGAIAAVAGYIGGRQDEHGGPPDA